MVALRWKYLTYHSYNRATELGAAYYTSETRSASGQRTVHFAASVANYGVMRRIEAATNSVDGVPLFHLTV